MNFVLAVFFIGNAAAQLYPDTHPFENEAVIPPAWPAATPSLSFDDSDPGGYIHVYAEQLKYFGGTITMDECPYCPCMNGFYMYLYVAIFEIPPMDPPDDWNCTLIGYFWKASDWTGVVAGERVCDVGSCCSTIVGEAKYSDDTADYESWLNNRVEGSNCGTPTHDLYCLLVGGDFWINCLEYTPTPTDRVYTVPCYDNLFLFYSDCQLFSVEFPITYAKEPPLYYGSLTVSETISVETYQLIQDKVCHPYSYFFPSSNSPAGADSGADSGAAPPSSSDSSSAATWAPVIAAFILATVS